MTERDPGTSHGRADGDVLPQAVGDRVLARASELDAALRSGASVAQLRTAALEAGISESAFDAALAEVQRDDSHVRGARRPFWWMPRRLLGVSLVLMIIGFFLAMRLAVPARPATGIGLVEEPIALQCLSHAEAEALIAPQLKGSPYTIQNSTVDGGRVLILSATRGQISDARELLANHEASLPSCSAAPGTATP